MQDFFQPLQQRLPLGMRLGAGVHAQQRAELHEHLPGLVGDFYCDRDVSAVQMEVREQQRVLQEYDMVDGCRCENLIQAGIAASTEDHEEQSIHETLAQNQQFWSSIGTPHVSSQEHLIYKLTAPLCAVRVVSISAYRAVDQIGGPVFPPARVSFAIGNSLTTLKSVGPSQPFAATWNVQNFVLPPEVVLGGYLAIRLHGKRQRQLIDMAYYAVVNCVKAWGRPHGTADIRTLRNLPCIPNLTVNSAEYNITLAHTKALQPYIARHQTGHNDRLEDGSMGINHESILRTRPDEAPGDSLPPSAIFHSPLIEPQLQAQSSNRNTDTTTGTRNIALTSLHATGRLLSLPAHEARRDTETSVLVHTSCRPHGARMTGLVGEFVIPLDVERTDHGRVTMKRSFVGSKWGPEAQYSLRATLTELKDRKELSTLASANVNNIDHSLGHKGQSTRTVSAYDLLTPDSARRVGISDALFGAAKSYVLHYE